ncbi:Uncharacterised protein [uncultured Clostridium sp.]|nr:hypothetical protein [Mediterraneibacter massiliensis]SCH07246.1 Uncharacterised protein [uncultured Clostridium sp.]
MIMILPTVQEYGVYACKKDIPYEIKPHRAGDIAMCYLLAIL